MPNRILKESICTSDSIDQLTAFQETVFYRLIVNCDDFGRFDGRPRIIASRLFPLKDIREQQIEDALRALTSAELVILYTVDGKPFVQMKTWDRHQQIRAKKSKYPAPDSTCKQLISNDIKCSRNPIQSNPIIEDEEEEEDNNARARITAAWSSAFGSKITPALLDQLTGISTAMSADVIIRAIRIAAAKTPNSPSGYIKAILKDWQHEHIRTVEDADEYMMIRDAMEGKTPALMSPDEAREALETFRKRVAA